MWFVRIVGGASGWFVVGIGNGLEDRFVMAREKGNR